MNILSQLKKILTKTLVQKKKEDLETKPKIIVVLGQTSTGKSDIAVEIARSISGEIISADSRQVYRGMDLGTGKIKKREMSGIPHYLLDVANPNTVFSVQDFQNLGTKIVNEILKKNKVPIICGGSGFYIDSLVYKTKFSSVGPNYKLRETLEKKPIDDLANILREKSPQDAKNIDLNNSVRIIRALEIIEELGHIPKVKKHNLYNILFIGLTLPKDDLNKRIHKRIIDRLVDGMLDEAQTLLNNGVSHDRLQSLGLEYRYMSKHILGEISHEEMIEQLYRDTVQFAKRQRTWFKRNKNIQWFDSITDHDKIFKAVNEFITK